MRARPTSLVLLGAAAWLVQPLYIASEFVVGHAVRTPYSYVDDTISELGIRGCRAAGEFADVCSPRHAWMNGSFIVFGLLLGLGALLLARHLPGAGRRTRIAAWLWVLSGIASAAVGLVPLDRSTGWHAIVAGPIFLLRPAALLLVGLDLRAVAPRAAVWTQLTAALTVLGVVGFAITLGGDHDNGAFERLALWPTDLWVAVAAGWLLGTAARREPVRA